MTSLSHQVWIDAPIERVYRAISTPQGVSSWWDEQTETHEDGSPVWSHSPPVPGCNSVVSLKVVERVPTRRLALECIRATSDNTAVEDWAGTKLVLELKPRADHPPANESWMSEIPAQTVLDFTHSGWAPDARYMAFCNSAWGAVPSNLKSVCEADD